MLNVILYLIFSENYVFWADSTVASKSLLFDSKLMDKSMNAIVNVNIDTAIKLAHIHN